MDWFAGVTASETRACTTFTYEQLLYPAYTHGRDRHTLVEPILTPVTKPWEPAVLLTEAIVGSEEIQVPFVVRSAVAPLLNVPVVIIGWDAPRGIVATDGLLFALDKGSC
jgi:hypothetical protein